MAEGIPTHSGRRIATVRQLKLLVVALLLSNIALGIFGFHSLRATDRKYSRLIDQTVPALTELEKLTASSVEVMRGTNPVFYEQSHDQTQFLSEARANLALNRELSKKLGNDSFPVGGGDGQTLRHAAELFEQQAGEAMDLLGSGKIADVTRLRDQSLRPAFEAYLAAAGKSADSLESESLRTSDTLSAQTGSVSDIILGVAGWPVLALGALLVAVVVIILLIRIFLFGPSHENAT